MSNMPKNTGTYELITPPTLKSRIGMGVGIDEELANRASSAVQHMRSELLRRAATVVGEITERSKHCETSKSGAGSIAADIAPIFRDLEMQGVALGYTLFGNICASLYNYTEGLEAPDDLSGKIVRAHTDALRSVVGNGIDGDGGQVGQALIESLDMLVTRAVSDRT